MKLLSHNKYIKKMFFKGGSRSVSDMFRKGTQITDSLFQKGRQFSGKVSHGSGVVGNILGDIANAGSSILNNQHVKNLANQSSAGRMAYNIGNKITNGAMLGSSLANQVSRFTDEKSYKGSHEDNIRDAIQRAKSIHKEGNMVNYV